jgi:hypothetical protein
VIFIALGIVALLLGAAFLVLALAVGQAEDGRSEGDDDLMQ